jgi:hypothetical protein
MRYELTDHEWTAISPRQNGVSEDQMTRSDQILKT